MTTDFAIEPLSEDALLLRFGTGIDAATSARVHAAARILRDAGLRGVIDIAPAYASLLVRFDPLAWPGPGEGDPAHPMLAEQLRTCLQATHTHSGVAPGNAHEPPPAAGVRAIDIPVCYGGDHGTDLDAVAERAGLSRDEVVARHVAGDYTVAMLGFAPGFPYLLGLDPALHVPRHASPRTRVPAGSIAIGGAQTGIYPRELPGGWNLIGRTPLALFDPARERPCLLAPGDRVRFHPIDAVEFARLAGPDT